MKKILLAGLLVVAAAPASASAADECPPIPGAVCGSLTVPLDRAQPSQGTTPVGYVLVRHRRPGPAVSAIVPNPGGPGESATFQSTGYAKLLEPLLDDHDLLIVDPRGVGRSGPLDCGVDASTPLTSRSVWLRGQERCGRGLGERARAYTSAAVTDDIEAVRAHLGIGQVDLLGQSYGTYLMQVYAQRHPGSIRSIVLSSAYPLDFDMWARTRVAATRRALRLVCARSRGRCRGDRVLADLARLAERLRRAPLSYEAGGIAWRLDDTALAGLVYGADPAGLGRLPAAVRLAVRGDTSRLLALAKAQPPAAGGASRAAEWPDEGTSPAQGRASRAAGPPAGQNVAQGVAVMCNDYPTLWDRSAPPRVRRRQYERARAALPESAFAPFGSRSWPRAIFDAGDTCLRWPDRHGPAQPTGGPFPDVPVLVLSGELDPNTPTSEGRSVARRFRRAIVVEVLNAGHVPENSEPCAGEIERGFLRDLRVPDTSCLRDIPPVRVERGR